MFKPLASGLEEPGGASLNMSRLLISLGAVNLVAAVSSDRDTENLNGACEHMYMQHQHLQNYRPLRNFPTFSQSS